MATSGQKEIRRSWPHESGLVADTTSQEGRKPMLEAQAGSLVPASKKKGLDY
jgi:hypothetical protein